MTALLEVLVEMRRLRRSVAQIMSFWREAQVERNVTTMQKTRAATLAGMCRSLRPELEELLASLDGIEERAEKITSSASLHPVEQERE